MLFLQKHGFRIPKSFIVSSAAFSDYLEGSKPVLEKLKKEISALPPYRFAVRSSTRTEDTDTHSFAGQFRTITDISGEDNILNAILKVWESVNSITGSEYHKRVSSSCEDITCAVILQEMVKPKLAGVSFSKNPVTDSNESVIEAVEGPGENLVQKGITPQRWRFKGGLILEGNRDDLHYIEIQRIARDTQRLKRHFGCHVDIEWAYDGRDLYYLQIRSITGKNSPPVYSNKMAKEMLPGQIKPLVWSVNIPLVNGTWIKLLSEITGPLPMNPEDLSKSFYYRTYFNMARLGEIFREFGLPPDSLEFMMGDDQVRKPRFKPGVKILKHTFRIIRFVYSKLHFENTFLKEYARLQSIYDEIDQEIRDHFTLNAYPEIFRKLFEAGRETAYLNIVVPLLMQLYNKRLSAKLKKLNRNYSQLDFHPDYPELATLSPVVALEWLKQKYDTLPDEIKERCNTYAALSECEEARSVMKDFNSLITSFGHLSESGNDFSVPKWQEMPEFVYQMMLHASPHESRPDHFAFKGLHYSIFLHPSLKCLYHKSGKYKVYREQISSLYIYGYGLFRALYLKLGNEFVQHGIIDQVADIFYISSHEIDQLLPGIVSGQIRQYKLEVTERKREMEETKDLLLPALIYGDAAPIIEAGNVKNHHGLGTSPGTYRGKTRIVSGVQDFSRVNRGEVLIIPFSDVSWTPILVKAGAIISESGGLLSHCSIIARELGIPALVSLENACSLGNGLTVTVDGSNGILTVHDHA